MSDITGSCLNRNLYAGNERFLAIAVVPPLTSIGDDACDAMKEMKLQANNLYSGANSVSPIPIARNTDPEREVRHRHRPCKRAAGIRRLRTGSHMKDGTTFCISIKH
jgi:hypothetical protein